MPEAEEAPDLSSASYPCTEEGCDFEGTSKARVGYHRWQVHGIRGTAGHKKRTTRAQSPPAPAKAPAKKEVAPKLVERRTPRKSGAGALGWIWSALSVTVVPNVSVAAARAMSWQAEAAGPVLDKAVAGSFLDKMFVQHIAGKGEDVKGVSALVGLPVCLMMIEKRPELAAVPMVRKGLYEAVKQNYESIMDARIAERRRQERWEAKALEAGMDITDANGNDVVQALVDDLLSTIFSEPVPEPVPV